MMISRLEEEKTAYKTLQNHPRFLNVPHSADPSSQTELLMAHRRGTTASFLLNFYFPVVGGFFIVQFC